MDLKGEMVFFGASARNPSENQKLTFSYAFCNFKKSVSSREKEKAFTWIYDDMFLALTNLRFVEILPRILVPTVH